MTRIITIFIIYISFIHQSNAYLIENTTSTHTITINKSSHDDSSTVSFGNKQPHINTVVLERPYWDKNDIEKLTTTFPNTKSIICIDCGLYNLGTLAGFKELNSIIINMLPVKRLEWTQGETPLNEILLSSLDYDSINSISITSSPITNVPCKEIGIWSKKITMLYPGRSNWPLPYKDLNSCYPLLNNVTSYINLGDKSYAKNVKKAHESYKKAFFINPYDQKAISSLSLSYYKMNEFCKSAQVSASGMELSNGNNKTRASILFNHYLAQLKLNNYTKAKSALANSYNNHPTDYKKIKLKNFNVKKNVPTNCILNENWIDDLKISIENKAIIRSRSDRDGFISSNNLNFKNYKTISTTTGMKTDDILSLTFTNMNFVQGIYAIIVEKEKGIERSAERRQLRLSCGTNMGDNILRERYIRLENKASNKILEVVKVFKVNRLKSSEKCYFGGDGWVFDSNNYKASIVKLDL